MRVVLDSSVFVFATIERTPVARAALDKIGRSICHAPHLFDAEVGNVLRRKVLAGKIVAAQAEGLLALLPATVEHRHEHTGPLAAMAWRLRGALTFYDAMYVALAASLDVPLLTADGRLSRAPGLPCQIEMVTA